MKVHQGSMYFCAKDIALALGYSNPRQACRTHVDARDRFQLKDLHASASSDLEHNAGATTYINVKGLKNLVQKSHKPNSLELAEALGFEVDTKYVEKEPEIVKHVRDFLDELRVATEFQKTVGRYRIDLYLPDYKLALEVDEHGHRNRDPLEERCREEFLRRALGCDFLRVNPDAPGFNIFKVCAQLSSRIMTPHSMHH